MANDIAAAHKAQHPDPKDYPRCPFCTAIRNRPHERINNAKR